MKTLVLAACTLALAACSSEKSGTFESDDGSEGSYKVDQDGDETNVSIKTGEGTLNIQSGTDVTVDLPNGFTLYPGARVIANTKAQRQDGLMTIVSLESGDSPAKMADFYRKQAEAAGVKIEMEMNAGDTTMIGGSNDKRDFFSFTASSSDGKTSGQLMLGRDESK